VLADHLITYMYTDKMKDKIFLLKL
jgi:hypothetical protein